MSETCSIFYELTSNMIANILWAVGGLIISLIFTNRKNIFTWLKSAYYFKEDIRVTNSYIFRVKIDNKYVLIKGGNIEQFQPIGGVYKYFSSFENFRKANGIRDDSSERFQKRNDLRQVLKGKSLAKYIRWFPTMENREVNVIRELIEELQISDIRKFILETEIEFINRVTGSLGYSTHFKMREQQTFDVFELRILSETIKHELKNQNNVILADIDDIEKQCFKHEGKSIQIAKTAKYII